MSKEKSDFKNGKKNNKPYYLQNISKKDTMVFVDEQITEKIKDDEPQKFKLSRLKDNNVLVSIDGERPHIIYSKQFFALTLASINICKLIIPDCNFDKVINNQE